MITPLKIPKMNGMQHKKAAGKNFVKVQLCTKIFKLGSLHIVISLKETSFYFIFLLQCVS